MGYYTFDLFFVCYMLGLFWEFGFWVDRWKSFFFIRFMGGGLMRFRVLESGSVLGIRVVLVGYIVLKVG